MVLQPIVEGHGEVSAVPVLLRRLADAANAHELRVNPPIRRKRSELVNQVAIQKAVRIASWQPDCRGILILFDSDDDCPKELACTIQGWAQAEATHIPCAVVLAHREYEAWFLGGIESLRGKRGIRIDAASHPLPETPRDAKGALEDCMMAGRTYSETADQAALTASMDLAAVHARCRSFRRMVRAFGVLAAGTGAALDPWPPVEWQFPGSR